MAKALDASKPLLKQLRYLLIFVALLWGLELIDTLFFQQRLNLLGIRPRSIDGLKGILFAPLLHGGFAHLATNTLPFLVLGFFVMLRGLSSFIQVTATIWLIGGIGIWLTGGSNTLHIGASIIIFGYLGYLLARAYFERSMVTLMIALFVGLLYGGMMLGVLPIRAGVSWQGHLFGFVGGVLAARWGREPSRLARA
ncbi:MAG: rhomboid family intramembrane serine protease [Trueperaceae bacterium]|nr:rhomboid family intramembrane serine protease [Trueperaceae bacterium]